MSPDGWKSGGKELDQSPHKIPCFFQSDNLDESATGEKTFRWASLRHHIWGLIQLHRARILASKESTLLDISQSMSTSSELITGQCNEDVMNNNMSAQNQCHKCCSVSTTLPKVFSDDDILQDLDDVSTKDMRNHLPKSKCLELLDKIWSSGLGHNLNQIQNPHHRLPVTMDSDGSSCQKCAQTKKLHAVDCVLPSGMKPMVLPSEVVDICIPASGGKIEVGKKHEDGVNLNVILAPIEQDLNATPAEGCSTSRAQSYEHPVTNLHVNRSVGTKSAQDFNALLTCAPPFKKAKHSWQVKNKTKARPLITESTTLGVLPESLSEADSVAMMVEDIVKTCDSESCDCAETEKDLVPLLNNPKGAEVKVDVLGHSPPASLAPEEAEEQSNDEDFQELNEALTQLNYVERWQCQHVAKAIVDNAINKTLEEMGLSPNDNGTVYREQRTRIEDAGVSQAILSRGLRRYSPNSYRMRHLNPIINRLTRVSEDLFSENLRVLGSTDDQLDDDDPPVAGPDGLVTPAIMDIYINFDESLSSSDSDSESFQLQPELHSLTTTMTDWRELSRDQTPAGDILSADLQESTAGQLHIQTDTAVNDVEQSQTVVQYTCNSDVNNCSDLTPESSAVTESGNHGDCLTVLEDEPSSMFLLDQAVDAVICERGLQFRDVS